MNFWLVITRQMGRNLYMTWASQLMTLLTVTLSVLIFAFFYLIYTNMLNLGGKLGDELSLIVYLEEEPGPALKQRLIDKINTFDKVEEIHFLSRADAYERFVHQLGSNQDVLDDMPANFLPPAIEITPLRNLRSLAQVKLFSEYLAQLPGTIKVQYGQEWLENFYYFTKLLSIVVLLSGTLLIMTTIFMVAYTIRLTILGRQAELELLKLVGATNSYIRTPFLLEGVLQGVLGSLLGLVFLFILFQWIKLRFSGPRFFDLFEFSFFSPSISFTIICLSVILCTLGSYSTMQKFLRI